MTPADQYAADVRAQIAALDAVIAATPHRRPTWVDPNEAERIDDLAERTFYPEPYVGTDADYYADRAEAREYGRWSA